MLIRFTTSFRMIDSTFKSHDAVCDALRKSLRHQNIKDITVIPLSDMIKVEFIIEATGFNDANIRGGRILLQAMDDIGIEVGNRDDIDRIGQLDEINDMSDRYLPDQARQLTLVSSRGRFPL